jgi:conjugative transfer signal peptidase TraF
MRPNESAPESVCSPFCTEGIEAKSKEPQRGDLVAFRLPADPAFGLAVTHRFVQPGECMLKRIAAVEGDVVTIDYAGVMVSGRLENSKPLPVDVAGRPVPQCRLQDYRLAPDEVLLMSDYTPIGFDGRYFGPISQA